MNEFETILDTTLGRVSAGIGQRRLERLEQIAEELSDLDQFLTEIIDNAEEESKLLVSARD